MIRTKLLCLLTLNLLAFGSAGWAADDTIPDRLFTTDHAPVSVGGQTESADTVDSTDPAQPAQNQNVDSEKNFWHLLRRKKRTAPPDDQTSQLSHPSQIAAGPKNIPVPVVLVTPPGEERYFPTREDGQPFVLNVDRTVNLTSALNSFYFDPRWRGEVWAPFDQVDTIERQTRLMSTWPEYDQFSILRIADPIHKFFEKYSGFGP